MTKQQGILGDTAINTSAMAISLAGGLGTQSILAWQLGPAGRGEYGVWLAVATIVAILFSLGADRAIQVHLISSRISVSQAVTSTLLVGLTGTVLGSAVIGYAAFSQWPFVENILPKSLGAALLVVPGVVFPTAFQLLLTGLRHFRAAAAISLLRSGSQLIFAAVFLIQLDLAIEGAFLSYAISAAISVVAILVFLSRRYGKLAARLPRSAAGQMLGYAIKYLPARLGNVVNGNLIILLLAFLATKDEAGFFSLAVVLMGQFLIVPDALNQSIVPRIGTTLDGRTDLVAMCCRYSLLFYGLLLVLGVVVLTFFMPILFSPKFSDCIVLLWILAPGVWLRGAAKPLLAYFIGAHRPETVSETTTIELIVTAVGIACLYPIGGLIGAAVAASIGQGCGAIALALAFRKQSKQNLAETWLVSSEDIRVLKDHAVALLGVPLKHRTFFSEAAAAKCDSTQIVRKTVITPTRVIKTQPPALFCLELARSKAIARIASQCNTFHVPRILGVHEAEASIEFEHLQHVRPLWESLYQDLQTDRLLLRTGQTLAEIHNRLFVQPEQHCELPKEWLPTPTIANVGLHGDFTASNVLYCEKSDQLYVVDCATSDLCAGQASVGPWCFDVAWFAWSLLRRGLISKRQIVALPKRINLFLDSYCQASRQIGSVPEFQAYFAAVSPAFASAGASNDRGFFGRIRTGSPSLSSIREFAQAMASDRHSLQDAA